MTPTTIPSVFFGAVVNHKIGTHARGAGPRDFLFDESGNGERCAEFFACREALAGCRGAALTRWSLEYRPCGGNTNMYLVPIFSPEHKQSIDSSASLSPPQERTVSRRRRETAKCASALNARMIFGTAATTAAQNSDERTTNHFAVFVLQPFRAVDKLAVQKTHEVCALIQTSLRFVCRAVCDAQKTRNGGNFRDRMCNCNTVTRDAITIAIWSGLHPDTPLA